MIGKAILPALLALLAGCATGYDYRAGNGDYYYGQPSVEYQDYGPYGDFGYGYPGGWSGMIGYGLGYGGYGYGPYGYGYPYPYGYGYPYIPRRVIVVQPDPPSRPGPRGHHDDYVPDAPGVLPSVRTLSPHDRHLLMADPAMRPGSDRAPMLSAPEPRRQEDRASPIRFEHVRGPVQSGAVPAHDHWDRDDGLRRHP